MIASKSYHPGRPGIIRVTSTLIACWCLAGAQPAIAVAPSTLDGITAPAEPDASTTATRTKVFILKAIRAEEAAKAVTGLITPRFGAAAFDPRTNKLIITDQTSAIEKMERLIEQIDLVFITRVFQAHYADVRNLAEQLEQVKSPAAPAPIVDERTRQVIVEDRLEIIRKMEFIVKTVDIPTPPPSQGECPHDSKAERQTCGAVRTDAARLSPGAPHQGCTSSPVPDGPATRLTPKLD